MESVQKKGARVDVLNWSCQSHQPAQGNDADDNENSDPQGGFQVGRENSLPCKMDILKTRRDQMTRQGSNYGCWSTDDLEPQVAIRCDLAKTKCLEVTPTSLRAPPLSDMGSPVELVCRSGAQSGCDQRYLSLA